MRMASAAPDVRPAAVAGSFYPRDPGRLRADVAALLAKVAAIPGVRQVVNGFGG